MYDVRFFLAHKLHECLALTISDTWSKKHIMYFYDILVIIEKDRL